MGAFRDQMERDLRTRGRSDITVYTYLLCMRTFVAHFMRPPDQLTLEDIKKFLEHVANELRVSFGKFNQYVAALRFFYSVTVKCDWSVQEIRYQKRWKRIPQVLSREQVEMLLEKATSLRSLAMLMTLYSTGLRLAECRWLKLSDIDSARGMIWVEKGKGKKDRYVMLSPLLLATLNEYIREAQPKFYLWENPRTGLPYDDTTIQQGFRDARQAAGITKKVTVHTLRHCFATHLLETGTDIRRIQLLLGHAGLRTTELYTHVASNYVTQTKSPLDSIKLPASKPKMPSRPGRRRSSSTPVS